MSWGWMPSTTNEMTLAFSFAVPKMRRPGMRSRRSVA